MPDDLPAGRRVSTNGLELVVHDASAGPVVVLLHGVPELAYSWRHQVPALTASCRIVWSSGVEAHETGFGHSCVAVVVETTVRLSHRTLARCGQQGLQGSLDPGVPVRQDGGSVTNGIGEAGSS